jgi:hypothetical protein
MSDITNDVIEQEDKARLNLTLSVRERIIRNLTDDGKLPSSMDDRAFLLQALDGMDRTVLSKSKIKADDKNNKSQQENAKMIAGILSRIPLKNTQSDFTRSIELPKEVTVNDPVPGEKDIGNQVLNYETFIRDVNK